MSEQAHSQYEAPAAQALPPPPPQTSPPPALSTFYEKSPGLAAVLSVLPGMGNIYNGLYSRGVAFFLTYVALFSLAVNSDQEGELAFVVPSMIFFWCFNIFDAFRQATLINYARVHGTPQPVTLPTETMGGLAPGVLLVLVGFYAMLRRYFDLDLDWLIDLWPIFLMAFGGFLIWQQLKRRPQPTASESSWEETP